MHDLPDHHQTWRWKRALAGTWREWKRAYERTGNRLLISEVLAYLDMTDFEESSLPASHDYVIA